ncbi:STAS domain-containing protein [Streptomyces pseudovenezuelae]|uniref:Anti-sigma factor antagonist n=1 Tax=Streptomyces pseudovenezuelae TaxID=67350 RepID=A0ABT6LUA4_9ACTN|nr:STAS domain-containing protein [Streptomyces pseudovenezuelae]MDH6219475.1 anti-sigma B factor antagonist [Streptomyces pseudovenezuelae]
MPFPQLTVYRHDRRKRALITLAGEIDLTSAPLVRTALAQCLRDGIHTIDIDLTSVTFCDCSGLNVFLYAAQRVTVAGGALRLHHPPPTLDLILDLTGAGFLLLGDEFGPLSPPPRGAPVPTVQTPELTLVGRELLAPEARARWSG